MQLYAVLDPEFWWIMLRGLWPVLVIPFVLGVGIGWFVGSRFSRARIWHRRTHGYWT